MDGIAATCGPGLAGSLLTGLSFAKGLSLAAGKSFIGINHLEGHLFANRLSSPDLVPPYIFLLISGGHTNLVYVKDWGEYEILGATLDDAVGEAFDKVGKILGLGYPAGPEIDNISQRGNEKAIRFPRSYLKKGSLDFSFSGVKTAVLYHCLGQDSRDINEMPKLKDQEIADLAASFQEAVVDVLVDKTIFAATKFANKSIILGGGVACNSRLRHKLSAAAKRRNIPLYFPSKKLCMDNAAMVAGLAYHKYLEKKFSGLEVEAMP